MAWAFIKRRLRRRVSRLSVRSMLLIIVALIVLVGMAAGLLDRWSG
jgi:fatty acid desaturase